MTDFEDAQCLLQNVVELNTGNAKWLYTDLNQNGQTQYSDGQQTVLSYIEYKGTFLQHMARLRKRYSECNIQVYLATLAFKVKLPQLLQTPICYLLFIFYNTPHLQSAQTKAINDRTVTPGTVKKKNSLEEKKV